MCSQPAHNAVYLTAKVPEEGETMHARLGWHRITVLVGVLWTIVAACKAEDIGHFVRYNLSEHGSEAVSQWVYDFWSHGGHSEKWFAIPVILAGWGVLRVLQSLNAIWLRYENAQIMRSGTRQGTTARKIDWPRGFRKARLVFMVAWASIAALVWLVHAFKHWTPTMKNLGYDLLDVDSPKVFTVVLICGWAVIYVLPLLSVALARVRGGFVDESAVE